MYQNQLFFEDFQKLIKVKLVENQPSKLTKSRIKLLRKIVQFKLKIGL